MIGRRRFTCVTSLALGVVALFGLGIGWARAEGFVGTAADAVNAMGIEAIQTVLTPELGAPERHRRLAALMAVRFDMPSVARQALGYHWSAATSAERQEFTQLFTMLLVDTYATSLRFRAPLSFTIIGQRDEGPRDALISTQLGQTTDGGFQRIDWQVRLGDDGKPRIIDVVVTGVSLVRSEQEEFDAAIRASSLGVEGLLAQLRAKYGTPVAAIN